jgi:hypothetical protein
MSERLYGTLKQSDTVIFTNVGLVLMGANITEGRETTRGSFFAPSGKRVKIGSRFQLHRPDGRWAEIEITGLDEKIDLVQFILLSGWQEK